MKNVFTELSELVVGHLRSDDAVTVGQLRAVLDTQLGASMGTMSMAEFLGVKAGKKTTNATKASTKASSKAKTPTKSGGKVNTRTPEGRDNYDKAILAFMKGKKGVSATDIRNACHGTPLQTRTALNRLIEEEKVTWEGQARGTKYSAA